MSNKIKTSILRGIRYDSQQNAEEANMTVNNFLLADYVSYPEGFDSCFHKSYDMLSPDQKEQRYYVLEEELGYLEKEEMNKILINS